MEGFLERMYDIEKRLAEAKADKDNLFREITSTHEVLWYCDTLKRHFFPRKDAVKAAAGEDVGIRVIDTTEMGWFTLLSIFEEIKRNEK